MNAYVLYYCNTVGWTWWGWSLILEHLPSVLWYCWLGHLTRKNPSQIWPIMCLVGRWTLLNFNNKLVLNAVTNHQMERSTRTERMLKLVWIAVIASWSLTPPCLDIVSFGSILCSSSADVYQLCTNLRRHQLILPGKNPTTIVPLPLSEKVPLYRWTYRHIDLQIRSKRR